MDVNKQLWPSLVQWKQYAIFMVAYCYLDSLGSFSCAHVLLALLSSYALAMSIHVIQCPSHFVEVGMLAEVFKLM